MTTYPLGNSSAQSQHQGETAPREAVSPPKERFLKNPSRAVKDPREGILSQWAEPGVAMFANEEAKEGNQ